MNEGKSIIKGRLSLARCKHSLMLACVLLLGACSSGSQYADIREFMTEVEKKPRGTIAPLPEFQSYQAFTYGASNQRSPFEPQAVIVQKTKEQRRNIDIKPPQDHVKQYLERFSIASLQMVGTFQRDDQVFALIQIQDGVGGVEQVQVGDYMGTSWGKIEGISDTRVDITEIVSDGTGGWLRKPRTIELKVNE